MLMLLLCKRNKLIKFKSKSTCRNKYQIGAGHIEIQLPQPYVVDSMKFVFLNCQFNLYLLTHALSFVILKIVILSKMSCIIHLPSNYKQQFN